MKVVVLSLYGGVRTEVVEDINAESLVSLVQKRKRGSDDFDEIFVYPEYDIVGFGWENGPERKINKTELPPPFDHNFFYGEMIVCRYNISEANYQAFTKKEYQNFIEKIHGGFDDCDDSGDESYNTTDEDLDWTPGCKDVYSEGEAEQEYTDEEVEELGVHSEEESGNETEGSWDFEQDDTDNEGLDDNAPDPDLGHDLEHDADSESSQENETERDEETKVATVVEEIKENEEEEKKEESSTLRL